MPPTSLYSRVVSFLRPDVALVMAILAVRAATEMHFGGVIEEYDGMGGDGRQHVVLAEDIPRVVAERETTAYHYRHLLPYATLHTAYRLLGVPYDVEHPRSIIVGHQVQNTLLLLLACFVWGRTLDHLRIGPMMRWLSFALLFLNFGLLKMPYYHPCNGDSAQFLVGLLMLHCFVTRRWYWLIAVATLGFYVRPGGDVYALALLAFRPPQPDDAPLRPTAGLATFAAGAAAIVVGLIGAFYFSPYFWVRVIQPPLGFLRGFSVAILAAFTYFAVAHLLRGFSLASLRRVNVLPLALFLATNAALRILTDSVARPPSLLETSELRMLFSSVALGVSKPAISQVAHVVYFGPAVALLYVLWPRVCRVAGEFGPGMIAALGVVVLLGLNSETRVLTTPFPLAVLLLVVVLDRLALPVSFAWATFAIALAWSRIWLSMGAEVPWSRKEFPDLLYWIHQGPWMPTLAYVVQGFLVAAMVAWFAWRFYPDALRGARSAVARWAGSSEPAAAQWLALRRAVAERIARVGRPLAWSIGLGWAGVLLAGLVVVPLVFARLPENAPRFVIDPEPHIVGHGVSKLRLVDATGGLPYLDGIMDIEWKPGPDVERGAVHFGAPGASVTYAYFNHLGEYDVTVRARFKAIPREFKLADTIHVVGLGPAQPLDFRRDGCDDLVWYQQQSGLLSIDAVDPNNSVETIDVIDEPLRRWRPRLVADFTADRYSDLLWVDAEGGGVAVHELRDGVFVSSRALSGPPPGWTLVTAAYVDGDGQADIVYRNPATNEVVAHLLRMRAVPVVQPLNRPRDPTDVLAAVADFSGDGRADLLWYNPTTGNVELKLTEEGAIGRSEQLPTVAEPGWSIVGCEDLDGDYRFDVLWHNPATGCYYSQIMGAGLGPTSAGADQVAVPADLDFVGRGWVVDSGDDATTASVAYWRHRATGAIWRSALAGPEFAPSDMHPVSLGPAVDWEFVMLGDFDGDGGTDLLLRHAVSGEALIGFGRPDRLEFGWPTQRQRGPEYVLIGPAPQLITSAAQPR
ncbi:MAG: VCBS repeat-containing protein [Phycisphaerae bacterium]|jgi:hypothetical protein